MALALLAGHANVPAQTPAPRVQHLRIVGGLAGLNQYTRHEEPFWTRDLARLSGGHLTAEIVPFDRAGIRGQEMLRLMNLGVVPFGTALLGLAGTEVPEVSAPDLAGLSPDMASLKRVVGAFRPHLERTLKKRYGIEVLAVYAYPAQVVFCNQPFSGLAGLADRRVRVSSPTQADWVQALGGKPVLAGFADIMAQMRGGNLDCAITGTMSGNTIGLHTVTSHVHTMAVSWGLAVFGANWARGPIAQWVQHQTGRTLQIQGDLRLGPGWPLLRVQVAGLRFANPAWAREPQMVEVDRADLQLDLAHLFPP